MKRAANLEKQTDYDRAILLDQFLIDEDCMCPFCKELECEGRGIKEKYDLWPAHAAKNSG